MLLQKNWRLVPGERHPGQPTATQASSPAPNLQSLFVLIVWSSSIETWQRVLCTQQAGSCSVHFFITRRCLIQPVQLRKHFCPDKQVTSRFDFFLCCFFLAPKEPLSQLSATVSRARITGWTRQSCQNERCKTWGFGTGLWIPTGCLPKEAQVIMAFHFNVSEPTDLKVQMKSYKKNKIKRRRSHNDA